VLLPAADPLLSFLSPLAPVDTGDGSRRLDRFSREAQQLLVNQIGPLANLRSSSGCAVWLASDSPWVELRLERLRHHQPAACRVAAEIFHDGRLEEAQSPDLRGQDGAVTVRLATGLERGRGARPIALWLPAISTCAVAGVGVAEGSVVELASPPTPRWLAIGDSLTQGFIVASPTQGWVHLVARRRGLPARNLGVGGIRIEPAVFAPALAERSWELVTIALGSNHAWKESDAAEAGARAAELAALACAGPHRRVVWMMPPWKPFEDGKGPGDFAGVPLDRGAAERMGRVRADLRSALAPFAPRLEVVEDLMPHDARMLPDGLHPAAWGAGRYAQAVDQALGEAPRLTAGR
jgi:lysophospholipase L1-like esterase